MLGILLVLAAVVALGALPGCDVDDMQEHHVTLALDFQPNAVHAGVYGAVATGADVCRRFSSALPELGAEVELVVYRVAQEALTNVSRHAEARTVELSLSKQGEALLLRVADDGKMIAVMAPLSVSCCWLTRADCTQAARR